MKTQLKLSLLVISSTLCLTAQASETNWQELIKKMNHTRIEKVKAVNKHMDLDIALLPDGKIRLVNLSRVRLPNQAILEIATKETNLSDLCKESLAFKNPFRAKLKISKANITESFSFELSTGELKNSNQIENMFHDEKTQVELVAGSKFPWTYGNELGRYKDGPEVKLMEMIAHELSENISDQISIDLSEHNGIACDLASGKAQISLSKKVIFEKGIPDKKLWIDKYRFADLYRSFWSERLESNMNAINSDIKNSELVLLGWSLADLKLDKASVFKTSDRINNLYHALKDKISNVKDSDRPDLDILKIDESWKKTFEYVIPTERIIEREIETFGDAVQVTFKG